MVEVTEWFEPSSIPVHGVPVLAEYYPFNTRSNALAQHVVWFWEGEYRQYPQTTGTAYVERWAHLPSYQQAAKAERDRIVAWLRDMQVGRNSDNYPAYFARLIEESQP